MHFHSMWCASCNYRGITPHYTASALPIRYWLLLMFPSYCRHEPHPHPQITEGLNGVLLVSHQMHGAVWLLAPSQPCAVVLPLILGTESYGQNRTFLWCMHWKMLCAVQVWAVRDCHWRQAPCRGRRRRGCSTARQPLR